MRMDLKTFSRIDPKLLGLDPKMLQGMDPKLLQSMGINLKALGMDSKTYASSSQPLYSTGSSVTTPLFYLSSNFPVSYPSIPPCSSFTTPIFYLTPQSPLFYSPLPNLLPQPLLWLCPPHSGPVTAPMESAAGGKICKLRRMHQLLAYHGQVSQASNQRVQQKSDRW